MSDAPPVVLIIDDDPQIRRFLRAGFDLEDFNVQEEQTGQGGLRSATLRQPDLIAVFGVVILMVWLGSGPAAKGHALHGPLYDFNDEIIPVGVSYWVRLVETILPAS